MGNVAYAEPSYDDSSDDGTPTEKPIQEIKDWVNYEGFVFRLQDMKDLLKMAGVRGYSSLRKQEMINALVSYSNNLLYSGNAGELVKFFEAASTVSAQRKVGPSYNFQITDAQILSRKRKAEKPLTSKLLKKIKSGIASVSAASFVPSDDDLVVTDLFVQSQTPRRILLKFWIVRSDRSSENFNLPVLKQNELITARCYKVPKSLDNGEKIEFGWPVDAHFHINGSEDIRIPSVLMDLTKFVYSGHNRIQMCHQKSSARFYVVFEIMSKKDASVVLTNVKSRSLEESKSFVVNSFNSNSDIQEIQKKVPVVDCLGRSRIESPGRFSTCLHLSVFDIKTWLTVTEVTRDFSCPVCRQKVTQDEISSSLYLDLYFKHILHDLAGKTSVDEITFFPDGTWKPVDTAAPEADSDEDSDFSAEEERFFQALSNRNKAAVIDLTLDDSSEEDIRPVPTVTTALNGRMVPVPLDWAQQLQLAAQRGLRVADVQALLGGARR